jgi:hypothetical protein
VGHDGYSLPSIFQCRSRLLVSGAAEVHPVHLQAGKAERRQVIRFMFMLIKQPRSHKTLVNQASVREHIIFYNIDLIKCSKADKWRIKLNLKTEEK